VPVIMIAPCLVFHVGSRQRVCVCEHVCTCVRVGLFLTVPLTLRVLARITTHLLADSFAPVSGDRRLSPPVLALAAVRHRRAPAPAPSTPCTLTKSAFCRLACGSASAVTI
jgi:hypothetical protein